jgi:hypothetical protein
VVSPIFPKDPLESLDLAHVYNGGRVIAVSDQHFGVGPNLLLPGRGIYALLYNGFAMILIFAFNIDSRQGYGRWLGNKEKPHSRPS